MQESNNTVLITGSNASMLSSELGTHLTGRYHEIELFPFSFIEYAQHRKHSITEFETTAAKASMQKLFRDYLHDGGFPGYLNYRQPEYLKIFITVFYTVILWRDIELASQ